MTDGRRADDLSKRTIMAIRFLRRDEIEKPRWDGCVHYAANGNVFGYTWYLDHVAKDWHALVEDDYQSVFPLVWRTHFLGFRELFQPPLIRELGVYSVNVISKARLRQFLAAIPDEYRRFDLVLNERNRPDADANWRLEEKVNYQLMLNEPYEVLAGRYSEPLRQRLQNAEDAGLRPAPTMKPEALAAFYERYSKDPGKARNVHTLQRIMYNVLHRGWGFASGAADQKGNLLAVNFYIFSHGKMMSLMPVASPEGKAAGALEFTTDLLLRTQANRPLLFDFNTSPLGPEFGAQSNTYYLLRQKGWWR